MKKEFNYKVKTGWQVDTFGHSSITPFLFKELGYENLIINRVDIRLKKEKKFEFFWNGMFTHLLHDHYSSPGYDFEGYFDPYIKKEERSQILLDKMKERIGSYLNKEHVLYMWGDDMRFINPDYQFKMMNELIEIINSKTLDHGYHVKYSTISEYFQQLDKKMYPNIDDSHDFFPYVDFYPFDVWSGFYSLRPSFKRRVRIGESLQRSVEFLNAYSEVDQNQLSESRLLNGLFQHHDAITGTHNENTARDYMDKALRHHQLCKFIIQKSLCLLITKNRDKCEKNIFLKKHPLYFEKEKTRILVFLNNLPWKRREIVQVKVFGTDLLVKNEKNEELKTQFVKNQDTTYSLYFEADFHPLGITIIKIEKSQLNQPNITYENIYKITTGENSAFFTLNDNSLTYFNLSGKIHKLSQSFHEYHSIPVNMFSTGSYIFRVNWGVFFLIGLGIGFVVGTIISLPLYKCQAILYKRIASAFIGVLCSWMIVHNIFSLCSDEFCHYIHKAPYTFGLPLGISIALFFIMIGGYKNFFIIFILGLITLSTTYFGNPQWIARPMKQNDLSSKGYSGPLVSEMNQEFSNIHQKTRIFKDKNFIEVSYLNIHSKKDLVTRFEINSKESTFYIDRNSFGWKERKFHPLKLMQSNYYPVTSRIKLDEQFFILSSQSLGVTKYNNIIEMMLYRYSELDDERGLESPVNDKIRGNIKFRFYFSKEGVYRASLEQNNPLIYYDIHPKYLNIQKDLRKNWKIIDEKMSELLKEKEVDLEIQSRDGRIYLRFTCHKENGVEIDLNQVFLKKENVKWMKHSLNLIESKEMESKVKLEKIMVFSKKFILSNK